MGDFSIAVKTVTFLVFTVFLITTVGYLLGRITVKGVSLGTAGVFIVALLYGCFFFDNLGDNLMVSKVVEETKVSITFVKDALKVVENIGLILFVTSVGFIAGPNFFGNFKKNFKSYVLIALVVIIAGGLTCGGCVLIDGIVSPESTREESASMLVGLLSGSLTSTPAFSAAKATVASRANGAELEDLVTVGHGIAYLFGVIGVVLFVQLVPKFMKADMKKERELLVSSDSKGTKKSYTGKLIEMDEFGFMPFALAAIVGIFIGSIKFGNFSLTTTGGCLLTSLIFGHFSHFGKVSVMPNDGTLKVFREFGLVLFLIGAGVAGGASFVEHFKPVYFIYGVVMTIIPMIIGFFFAKYVLKLSLLNNLGSITGGMTSTPALGTLISTAGTENVASAYAATYPAALISVVIVSQVLLIIFK
ncbi:MAG: permease [Ruminococcus sp.]|nr:permease [Ruminococcus sp.]